LFLKDDYAKRPRCDETLNYFSSLVMQFELLCNLVPRLFPLRASLEDGPGWSRVSQILGDNKLFAQGWGAKFVLPI
jgi:hypothetical protein